MSGFTTPDGERFTIFGEGGGQELADELDVPLLGKVPLTSRCASRPTPACRSSSPTRTTRPPRRIRQAARGLIAMFPRELPVLQLAATADGPPAPQLARSRPA